MRAFFQSSHRSDTSKLIEMADHSCSIKWPSRSWSFFILLILQLHNNYNYNYNFTTTTTTIYTTLNDATLTTTTTTTTTTLLYTTLHKTTLRYPTLHYTRPITPLQYDCNYTTLITLHHNYNSTTLQLRLQLQYTTLHPAVVGEVTTATIATTPTNTTPTTFRSISEFALPSVIHNNQPLL